MMAALPCAMGGVPMCRQAGVGLPVYKGIGAERDEGAEGKIKETGTSLARFRGKPLSAHCFGTARAAPCFSACSAALSRNTLALLAFDRHHRPKSAVFRGLGPEARL